MHTPIFIHIHAYIHACIHECTNQRTWLYDATCGWTLMPHAHDEFIRTWLIKCNTLRHACTWRIHWYMNITQLSCRWLVHDWSSHWYIRRTLVHDWSSALVHDWLTSLVHTTYMRHMDTDWRHWYIRRTWLIKFDIDIYMRHMDMGACPCACACARECVHVCVCVCVRVCVCERERE